MKYIKRYACKNMIIIISNVVKVKSNIVEKCFKDYLWDFHI